MKNKKYQVPGYTGYIRGGNLIDGRTYGDKSRKAYDTQFEDLVCQSPIPSGPEANRHIENKMLKDTFVSNNMSDKKHVPGYTGYVPGGKQVYGVTYGKHTAQYFSETGERANSVRPEEGYADTVRPRNIQTLSSNPLPGLAPNKCPIMLVEAYHTNLMYRE
jgi:hypothetical protein